MAVLALQSAQMAEDYRLRPTEKHGKLRFVYFNLPAVAVAGDANTTVDLCELPPGQVRVLPHLSRITTSAFGASRTLAVGHYAYQKSDSTTEAENATAFVSALDVSSAVTSAALGTSIKYDMYSKAGVTIFAKVAGGTIPVSATVEGYIAYLYE